MRAGLLIVAAIVTGTTMGVGVGLPLAHGDASVVVMVLVANVAVAVLLRITAPDERVRLAAIVGIALGLRLAAAAVLYYGSVATGRGGFITGDDAGYARLAWGFLAWLRGDPIDPYVPPLWGGYAFLFGTFVYLESALFLVFGPTILAMTSLNAVLGAGIAVLVYDIARRLWDQRSATLAAAAIAVYPSLVLWSAVNLKDTLTLALAVATLWVLSRMLVRPHWYHLAAIALLLLSLESLRRYLFVGMAVLVPLSVLLSRPRRRTLWAVASAAVTAAVLVFVMATGGIGGGSGAMAIGGFADLERLRAGMAAGARTAFAEGPASVPYDNEVLAFTRTIAYLPRGLAYALFAPFPWAARGLGDLATIPEMVLWYVSLVAVPFTLRDARRWRQLAPFALYVVGLLGLFVLVEGNVGTLFRHRAMVIPFVLMLAAPAILRGLDALQRRQ